MNGTLTMLTTDRRHFGAEPTGTTMILSNFGDDTSKPIGQLSKTGKMDEHLSDEKSEDDDDNGSFKNFEAPKYISANVSPINQMGFNGSSPARQVNK